MKRNLKNFSVVLFALTLWFLNAQSQEYKNSYRIGMHIVNLEDDKFAGDFYYNQYNRKIAKRIETGIGLGLISYNHIGKKEWLSEYLTPFPSGQKDAVVYPNGGSNFSYQWLLNANVSYAPIQHRKFQLKFGCGFSMTHYAEGYVKGGSIEINYDKAKDKLKYSTTSQNSYAKVISFAYNFFVEPEWSVTPRFFVSARVSPYFFYENLNPYIYSAGIAAGVRF